MSNFKTFGLTSDGYQGTAPSRYQASTADNLATIIAAGYMNDMSHVVKVNDVVEINYSDTTVLPAQISATYGQFQVVASGSNLNLSLLGSQSIGAFNGIDVTVTASALAAAAHVPLIPAINATSQIKIRGMYLNGFGTNFSGGGGDRALAITDGSTVYSIIPAATLQALANTAWGATGLPFPATAAIDTATAAGQPLYAVYSGGSADYTAGSLVLTINYDRVV